MLVYYVIIVNYFLLVNTNLQLIILNLLSFVGKERDMGKDTIWYGLEPKAAIHRMNEGDLLFSGNKAFRKEKGNLEEIKKA